MYNYTIITDEAEKLRIIHRLFAQNDNPKSTEHLRWQYTENPGGGSHLVIATEQTSGDVGGMYAVFCVEMDVLGKTLHCVQSLDTLTDKNHRGKGLFTKLSKQMYDELERGGTSLVYGFPNANSAHGFFTKLEWKNLNPTPFLIRLLNPKFVMRKLKLPFEDARPDIAGFLSLPEKNPALRIINSFDESATVLWKKFSDNRFIAVRRSADYLNWRYCNKPGFLYRKVGAYDANGNLTGYIIGSLQQKHGTAILYIMELITDPATADETGEQLLCTMLRAGRKCGAEVSLAWAIESAPTYAVYRNNWFFPLPERFRPIELNFGYRCLADKTTFGRRQFYLSYSDSDTV